MYRKKHCVLCGLEVIKITRKNCTNLAKNYKGWKELHTKYIDLRDFTPICHRTLVQRKFKISYNYFQYEDISRAGIFTWQCYGDIPLLSVEQKEKENPPNDWSPSPEPILLFNESSIHVIRHVQQLLVSSGTRDLWISRLINLIKTRLSYSPDRINSSILILKSWVRNCNH